MEVLSFTYLKNLILKLLNIFYAFEKQFIKFEVVSSYPDPFLTKHIQKTSKSPLKLCRLNK